MPHQTTSFAAIKPLPDPSSLQGNHPHNDMITTQLVLAPPAMMSEEAKVTTASTSDQDPTNNTIISTSSTSSSQDIHNMQSSPIASRSYDEETIQVSERPVPSASQSAAGMMSDPMTSTSQHVDIVPSSISGPVVETSSSSSTIRPVVLPSASNNEFFMSALHQYRSMQPSSITHSDDEETITSATRTLLPTSQSSTGSASDPVVSSVSSQDRMPSCISRPVETSSTIPSAASNDVIMPLPQQDMHMPSSIARSVVETSSATIPVLPASQSSTGSTSDPVISSASSQDRMHSCTSRPVKTISTTLPLAASSDAIMSSSQQDMHMPSSIARPVVETSSAIRPIPVPSNPSVRPDIEKKKKNMAAEKRGNVSSVLSDPKQKKMSRTASVTQIRSHIFRTHLHAVMRAGGWNINVKYRANDHEQNRPDITYFPPGVTAGRPFTSRVHYFDSKVDLRKYMLNNVSRDKVSSYVLRFDDRLHMLLRSERGKRIKTEAEKLGDAIEVMAEKLVAIVEEEMLLHELDQSIKGITYDSSDKKQSPLQSSSAQEPKPPSVGEKAIISPKQEESKTAPLHSPHSKKRPRNESVPTSSRESDPTASVKRKKIQIDDSPQSDLKSPLQSSAAEERKPPPVGDKAIISSRQGELKTAPGHALPSKKRPRKEPAPTSSRESDPTDEAKRKHMNKELDDHPQSLFVVNKKLPKFIGNTRKLLFPPKVLEKLKKDTLSGSSKQDSSATSSGVLKISCLDIRNDPDSVRIRAQGRGPIIKKLEGKITHYLANEAVSFSIETLTASSRYEVDLRIDTSDPIGVRISQSDKGLTGILVLCFYEGSQLKQILGSPIDHKVVLLKLDGIVLRKTDDLIDMFRTAKEEGRKEVIISLCLSVKADIHKIDANRIVSWPKRIGGKSDGVSSTQPIPQVAIPKKRKIESATPNRQIGESATLKTANDTKYANYSHFTKKYKQIRTIEYGKSGIHAQLINKLMWKKHKEIIGEHCDDNCPCPVHLARMTEDIVGTYISQQQKDNPNWKNSRSNLQKDEQPVGFVNNFVLKFANLVQSEFPGDNPVQVLEKLERMWAAHTTSFRYGLTCKSQCPCHDGWQLVFLPKCREAKVQEKSNLKVTQSRSKKGTSTEKDSQLEGMGRGLPDKVQRSASDTSIGLGRSAGVLSNAAKQSEIDSAISVSKGKPARTQRSMSDTSVGLGRSAVALSKSANMSAIDANTTVAQTMHPLSSSKVKSQGNLDKEYCLSFNPSEPLGFFCVTDHVSSKPLCKIMSVSPSAQQRDPRLKIGTIVVATYNVYGYVANSATKKIPVSNHVELQKRYEAIKQKGELARFRLWFSNTTLPSDTSTSDKSAKKSEWSDYGFWLGDSEQPGWAGGALSGRTPLQPKEAKKLASTFQNPNEVDIDVAGGKDRDSPNNNLEPLHQTPRPGMYERPVPVDQVNTVSMTQPNPIRSRPQKEGYPTSLLLRSNRNREKSKRKRVSIDESLNQTKIFTKDSEDSGVIDQNSTGTVHTSKRDDTQQPIAKPRIQTPVINEAPPREGELVSAVVDGNCMDVVCLLKRGAPASHQDSENKTAMDYLKEKLEILEEESRTFQDIRHSRAIRDFRLKKKLLKIYLTMEHVIELALHLKSWVNVELVVNKVKELQLSKSGAEHQSADFLFCQTVIDKKKSSENDMPLIPFTSSPDWSESLNLPRYIVQYNPNLDYSFRPALEVVVKLVKGNSHVPSMNITLGTWNESVERLKYLMETNNEECEIERDLIRTEFITSGKMIVKACSCKTDTKQRQTRVDEAKQQLREVIDWIESFNAEAAMEGMENSPLNGDLSIGIPKKSSLLHAAVFLADDTLVRRLLDLGADPLVSSIHGTPISLAGNLADKMGDNKIANMQGKQLDSKAKFFEIRSLLSQHIHLGVRSSREQLEPTNDALHSQSDNPQQMISQVDSTEEPTLGGIIDSQALEALANQVHSIVTIDLPNAGFTEYHSGSIENAGGRSTRDHWASVQRNNASSVGNMAGNSSSLSPPRTVDRTTWMAKNRQLPILHAGDWLLPSNKRRCKEFNKAGRGCKYGRKCHFAHVRAPLGAVLDDTTFNTHSDLNLDSQQKVIWRKLLSQDVTVYTAGYFDQEENVYHYAERGEMGCQSSQGIYWYPSELEATSALRKTVELSKRMTDNKKKHFVPPRQAAAQLPPENNTHYGPPRQAAAQLPPENNTHYVQSRQAAAHLPLEYNSHYRPPRQAAAQLPPENNTHYVPSRQAAAQLPLESNSNYRPPRQAAAQLPPENNTHYGPPRRQAAAQLPPEYNMRENSKANSQSFSSAEPGFSGRDTVTNRNNEISTFRKLATSNISNIYAQMYRNYPLRKTYWTTHSIGGVNELVTAELRLPGERENDADVLFLPSGHGGQLIDEKWYYKSINDAKASVFLQLMKEAASKGVISKDLKYIIRDGSKRKINFPSLTIGTKQSKAKFTSRVPH